MEYHRWDAQLHCERICADAGFALIKMLGALAAFVGNYVFGAFSSDGKNWTGVMALLAGVLFLGAVMTLFFREPGASFDFFGQCVPAACALQAQNTSFIIVHQTCFVISFYVSYAAFTYHTSKTV